MSPYLMRTVDGHKEYYGIQSLRFVAALMVVVTHSTFYASERMHAANLLWPDGVKGVDLFFVISGFVMYISGASLAGVPGGWRIFITRRLVRIAPLYWLFTTVKLVIMLSTDHLVLHAKFDPVSVVCSYLFMPSYNIDGRIEPLLSVGWTLNFEMLFYAIFAVAIAMQRNLLINVIAVLTALTIGSFFRPASGPAVLFYLNPIVLEFALGMLIAAHIGRDKLVSPSWALALLMAGMAALLAPFADSLPKVIGDGIPAGAVVYAVACLENAYRQKIPRMILFFGAASYSLYLTHPLVAPLAPTILSRLAVKEPVISILGSVALALIVASVVFVLVEKPLTIAAEQLVWGKRPRLRDQGREGAHIDAELKPPTAVFGPSRQSDQF